MSKTIIGIDPGSSGAMAALIPGRYTPEVFKLDNTEADIAAWLAEHDGSGFAFIESVHAMPKQGVSSCFKFGQSYGFLRGLLIALQIPFEEVTPQKWQKELGCLTKGDKNVSKARAQQLFPSMKITHATADSVLITEFGRRVLAQRQAA